MCINYVIYGVIHTPNSENVIVIRNNPEVAKTYLSHWQSRWEKGQDWTSTY